MPGHHPRTITWPYICGRGRTGSCVISRQGASSLESVVPLVTTSNTIYLTPPDNTTQVVIINTTLSSAGQTPEAAYIPSSAARTIPSPVLHIPAITTAVRATGEVVLINPMTIYGFEFASYIVKDYCQTQERQENQEVRRTLSQASSPAEEKKSLKTAVQSTSREHSRHASPVQSSPQASRPPKRRTCQRPPSPPFVSAVERTIIETLAPKKRKRKWCRRQVNTAKKGLQILVKKFRKTAPVQSPLLELLSSSALAPAPAPAPGPA
ncbi:uncharacterized protein Bfra_002784ia [Botrytis fragariae]|uniref:Uncharacterized protein n=1 Tax=Botrytis fragariae TaxID=1964551 RepID=A0A8H6AZL1_9HELO|nr:uncharacterized protein Bfra_002784ia [Botrytis fragariae]KAF5876380.1 hypothetical protein Bfra_002784ia [Botrytis fragariae]